MKLPLILFLSCILMTGLAQESRLLLNKAGTFKIVDVGVYDHYDCGFTRSETSDNYKKLADLIGVFRKNPVLAEPRGFDCRTLIGSVNCKTENGHGIPCDVSFQFCSWSIYQGKETCWLGEPPEWTFTVNMLKSFGGGTINVTTDEPSSPPPGFNMAQWEKAADKVNEMFFTPGAKETIASGIDRYKGEFIIIYNPGRPSYWKHVRVSDAFEALKAYWKLHPDRISSDAVMKFIEKEYSGISEKDRDGFAYYAPGTVSMIGSDSRNSAIMVINPDYWDKTLPRSAIQILSFNCQSDKAFVQKEKEERLENQSGYYFVSCFIENIDLNLFPALIGK